MTLLDTILKQGGYSKHEDTLQWSREIRIPGNQTILEVNGKRRKVQHEAESLIINVRSIGEATIGEEIQEQFRIEVMRKDEELFAHEEVVENSEKGAVDIALLVQSIENSI